MGLNYQEGWRRKVNVRGGAGHGHNPPHYAQPTIDQHSPVVSMTVSPAPCDDCLGTFSTLTNSC
jgi:hypothetical protein